MIRGTTPTFTFTTDMDLTGANVLYVSFMQNERVIVEKNISDAEISAGKVVVKLQQGDTLRFDKDTSRPVSIQIRAGFPDGSRVASNIMTTSADRILKDGEI